MTALTQQQLEQNRQTASLLFIDEKFAKYTDEHKTRLIDAFEEFAKEKRIDLSAYIDLAPSDYKTTLITALGGLGQSSISDQQIWAAFQQWYDGLVKVDAAENKRYIEDPKKPTILSQLKSHGYVQTGQLLEGDDIKQLLDDYLKGNPDVGYADPLSITDGVALPIREALKNDRDNKDAKKLFLIPVNVNSNHWVFLIRERDGDKVNLTLWNPMKQEYNNEVTDRFREILKEVYNDKQIHNDFGEQKDGDSCGVRILQKMLQVAKVKGPRAQAFINASAGANDSKQLFFECVKLIATTDKALENADFSVSETTVCRIDNEGKDLQLKADENLAVYVQDVYRTTNLNDKDAVTEAHKRLSAKNNDIVAIKEKAKECQSHFFRQLQSNKAKESSGLADPETDTRLAVVAH